MSYYRYEECEYDGVGRPLSSIVELELITECGSYEERLSYTVGEQTRMMGRLIEVLSQLLTDDQISEIVGRSMVRMSDRE